MHRHPTMAADSATPTIDINQILDANLPDGALQLSPISASGEEQQRLQAAERAAIQGGTSAPLVREELRQRLLLRRLQNGQPPIETAFTPPRTFELTPEEKIKKERRREQNRRAARKCRQKKRKEESGVSELRRQTEKVNQQLKTEVHHLQHYLSIMKAWLLSHLAICSVRHPDSPTPVDQHQQPQQNLQHQQPQQNQLKLQQQQSQRQQQHQNKRQQQHFLWPTLEEQSPQELLQPAQNAPQSAGARLLVSGDGSSYYIQTPSTSSSSSPVPDVGVAPPPQHYASSSPLAAPGALPPTSPSSDVHLPTHLPPFPKLFSCSGEGDQPMLGSQGFDAICSQLQSLQDYPLDSQELNDVLAVVAADSQGSCATGAHQACAASASSGPPALPPAVLDYAAPRSEPSWATAAASSGAATTASLSPPSPASHLLPSSVADHLQRVDPPASLPPKSPAPPVSARIRPSPVETDGVAALELPGFPFSQRRKRKSVDSCPRGRPEAKTTSRSTDNSNSSSSSSQPKMLKSATYSRMVETPSPADVAMFGLTGHVTDCRQPASFTLEGGLVAATGSVATGSVNDDGSGSTITPSSASSSSFFFPLNGRHGESVSPAPPPSPFFPLVGRGTPSPCASAHSPSPSPSPRSPCSSFRFSSVTPPPLRCSAAPLQPRASPLTPPPPPRSPPYSCPFSSYNSPSSSNILSPSSSNIPSPSPAYTTTPSPSPYTPSCTSSSSFTLTPSSLNLSGDPRQPVLPLTTMCGGEEEGEGDAEKGYLWSRSFVDFLQGDFLMSSQED